VAERILLIDDDRELTSMLGEYLGRSGLRCEARHDVATGLRALREDGPFDLAILDVMLPDGDGLELCRTIRAESPIPIVMLTARGDDPDRIVGLELGADDYLAKPFNPRELQARVRAVLRRGRLAPGAGAALRFGRLEIDAGARRVTVDGEERALTSAQFDLLLALAENAGRVMTRDALMNTLRGRDNEPFDRSIDVHVSRIRASIEDDPKRPRRILTVRGVGYVFPTRHDA
jgi:two-component system phosphate regulon response regulator OmpR